MASPDPEIWKEATKFLWAGLALPIAHVWRKVNGAVQKEDFKEYAKEISTVVKEHAAHDERMQERTRENLIDIFRRLEEQGKGIERIETTLTFLREKR